MSRLTYERQFGFGRGQNSVSGPAMIRQDEVALLQDGRVSMDGSFVVSRGGSRRTHSTALNLGAAGRGGSSFQPSSGDPQLVVFVGDTMYYSTDEGVTWTQGATGLSTARSWSTAVFRNGQTNYLFCCNGGALYTWNGTTWAQVQGGPQPNGGKYLAVFNDRLWIAGHDGVRVWASRVGDAISEIAWDVSEGALQPSVQTHDDDLEPTGLYPLGQILLVFKRSTFGYIEGFGSQSLFVQVGARGQSRSVGCVAHRTIRAVGDAGVCFLSERGVEFYTLGAEPVCVSTPVQDIVQRINWSAINSDDGLPTAVYWPLYREYHVAVPLDSASQNTRRLVFRPPNERSGVPMVATHTAVVLSEVQGGLYLDGRNNYLEFQSGPSGFAGGPDADGYLQRGISAENPEFFEIEAGYLQLYTPDYGFQTMFSADRTDGFAMPFSVGNDGFVRKLEFGDRDDVLSDGTGGAEVAGLVEFRPFLGGDPFTAKRGRRIRIHAKASVATNLNASYFVDETTTGSETMTFGPSTLGPEPKTSRVGGRGFTHRVRAILRGDLEVHGVEVGFKPTRRGA